MSRQLTRVLVTGGNGLIGSHLAEKLEGMGETVTLFDRKFDSNTASLGCEKVWGDITDYHSVSKAVDQKNAIFHFAAVSRVAWGQEDPYKCWLTNQLGTVNVLEACAKSRTKPVLFYASSREVYGEPVQIPVKESHPKRPISVYGMTKLSAENTCQSYATPSRPDRPISYVVFRFSNVYGSERDLPERVIPKFIAKAIRGEDITLYGGNQILDFTFIDDAISGILRAYRACFDDGRSLFGEDFHFVTGKGTSVSDLAKKIVELVGSSSRIIRTASNSFEVQRFVGDPGKSHDILGYQPRFTIDEGLKLLRERILPAIVAR